MFIKKSIYIVVISIIILTGCKKEGTIPYEPYEEHFIIENETDEAIYDIYKDYQSKIIYRWDRRYITADAFASPPQFELVLPFIDNVIRKLFIAPYDRQKADFMRAHMPIEMILFGTQMNYVEGDERNFSAAGLAYGLSRVIITGVNGYNLKNSNWLRGQYATLHHEFAHVLDKKYGRPAEFDKVSEGKYAGGTVYSAFTQAEARNRGFWRNYGMSNESEDFATWVDGIVTTPKADVLVIAAGNDLLAQKYKIVYNFYLDKGIDLHFIQEYLQNVLDNL
ncbi:substrate import-associated zinc metallohydrolase lipoprotein [Gynurincola endophyticus]|uniref:substrate import-associated zinc metallohydrolase lipoprotein n=1 Tax=Gynurincola endophyticus TaxID=2479004 RepID=UPI000F8CC480|nr:substrate import-associated zinc metallohydrolase lipoprotein [Gynurincola endophyticus]